MKIYRNHHLKILLQIIVFPCSESKSQNQVPVGLSHLSSDMSQTGVTYLEGRAGIPVVTSIPARQQGPPYQLTPRDFLALHLPVPYGQILVFH